MIRTILTRLPGFVLALAVCSADASEPAAWVIVNARIIDGGGGPSRHVNLRVIEDRIAAIGDFEPSAVDRVIDATGLVLAPGFIDSHSHHEGGLFKLPDALAAVNQGITTIVVGQDGGQPYPLSEFFSRLESSPVAINVASYAGHGTLRGQVMQDDYQRYATPEELAEMLTLLHAEMEAGALGLSTGLEYDPGSFASTDELVELARAAASHGGIYASHVRNEDQYIWAAIDETIDIGRQAQIPVRVTHIKLAISRWWGQADRLKRKLDDARAAGIDITADIYPYRAWYAGFGWFATLFPDRDLTQRAGAEYILNDMLAPDRIVIPVYKPNPAYNNLSIAEIADLRGDDPETTLMALLQEDAELDSEGSGSETLAFAMDEPDIESIMAWPHTVIASDGGSTGAHPRGYNTFSRFLGHYVRDRQVVSLEQGVRKITALPAEQVGISKRGSIAVGHYADLVLFNPNTIKDNATFEAPHVNAAGIEKVWVNGQLVYEDGEVTGNRPGKPLRRVNP